MSAIYVHNTDPFACMMALILLLLLLVDIVVKRLEGVPPAPRGASRKGIDEEVRDPALCVVLEQHGHPGRVRVVLLRTNDHS